MKKLLNSTFLLFFLMITVQFVSAQEFSFYLYFEDAMGHRDSLLLGYDSTATNGWDEEWGEVNIIDQPWDSTLEVRVTTEWIYNFGDYIASVDTFQSRVWIGDRYFIPDDPFYTGPGFVGQLAIKTSSFPVIISYDQNLFQDSSLIGSLLTCVNPGGWWDIDGCHSLDNPNFENADRIIFSQDSIGIFDINGFYSNNSNRYINTASDTLYYFWFIFGEGFIGVSTRLLSAPEQVSVYPNPVEDILSIDNDELNSKARFNILDIHGRQLYSGDYSSAINVSDLVPGFYILHLYTKDKQMISKFVKR